MKKFQILVLTLVLSLAACGPGGLKTRTPTLFLLTTQPPTFTPQPTPATPTAPPLQETTGQKVVIVSFRVAGDARTRPEVDAGSTVKLELAFEPAILTRLLNQSGTPVGTSSKPWADAPIAQMQVCWALDKACEPDGRWQSYQPKVQFDLAIDWLGPRPLWAAARFRTAAGEDLPTAKKYEFTFAPVTRVTFELAGRLNSLTPIDKFPSRVMTAAAATSQGYPVTGSVLIEGGRCCAGGTAGSTITLKVEFNANSTSGDVTEMRLRQGGGCLKDSPSLDAPWEKFTSAKTFTTTLALNWVGWYINVQYRDSRGGLSPVYCDDISLEGSPSR